MSDETEKLHQILFFHFFSDLWWVKKNPGFVNHRIYWVLPEEQMERWMDRLNVMHEADCKQSDNSLWTDKQINGRMLPNMLSPIFAVDDQWMLLSVDAISSAYEFAPLWPHLHPMSWFAPKLWPLQPTRVCIMHPEKKLCDLDLMTFAPYKSGWTPPHKIMTIEPSEGIRGRADR